MCAWVDRKHSQRWPSISLFAPHLCPHSHSSRRACHQLHSSKTDLPSPQTHYPAGTSGPEPQVPRRSRIRTFFHILRKRQQDLLSYTFICLIETAVGQVMMSSSSIVLGVMYVKRSLLFLEHTASRFRTNTADGKCQSGWTKIRDYRLVQRLKAI